MKKTFRLYNIPIPDRYEMDFIINLNKPAGITSQDAVTKVKKTIKAKKAGHAGTLDPAATGVLLVCTNRATRLASYFSDLDKEYRAVIKLGEVTDTQDAQGKVIEKSDSIDVDESAIKSALGAFEGETLQQPPMYSALKHEGKPLYKYARQGIDVPRKQRKISIHKIELLDIDLPFAGFTVVCSKGTYIRTLCHDIGKKLGTGAHLFKLERTAIGPFSIKDSLSLEELSPLRKQEGFLNKGVYPDRKQEGFLNKGVYTMDSALSWMPEYRVTDSQVGDVQNGVPVSISGSQDFLDSLAASSGIRVKSPEGLLLAIGSFQPIRKTVKMDVVFG